MTFIQKLEASIARSDSLVCVGLDTDFEKLPQSVKTSHHPLVTFNKAIIDNTHDLVACYKLQIAYYSSLGLSGIEALEQTIHYLTNEYPDIPLILDAKRGDIGDTSEKYAQEVFDTFEVDAVTVNPYMGKDSLLPFLKRKTKGVIVLCRTSNKGAEDFQSLRVDSEPLYVKIAAAVSEWHNEFQNCLLVVGATWPEEMKEIRQIAKDLFFLVPGIGAQGGDIENTLKSGLRPDKSGLLIHSSRAIIYASDKSDFAEKARKETITLRDTINTYRYGHS